MLLLFFTTVQILILLNTVCMRVDCNNIDASSLKIISISFLSSSIEPGNKQHTLSLLLLVALEDNTVLPAKIFCFLFL